MHKSVIKYWNVTYLSTSDHSHSSGRTLDRIMSTLNVSTNISHIYIDKKFRNSDHYPVVGKWSTSTINSDTEKEATPVLLWKKASEKALLSYSRLSQKLCSKSLVKFKKSEIDGIQLYSELVNNLETAAKSCIPKSNPNKTHPQHNKAMWRERMASYKTDVDYWLAHQHLYGGPNVCPAAIRLELRLARSRYRRQFRILKREIEVIVAESVTMDNCFKRLYKSPAPPTPAMIEGHSKPAQPSMWRAHYNNIFRGETTPYDAPQMYSINPNDNDISQNLFTLDDINETILQINTNKSYTRHNHWKNLNFENHSAKRCLLEVLNFWQCSVLSNNSYFEWDLFLANLRVIPKKGKKDLSLKKSWRPISIGTSENWILEKIILSRLLPFLQTEDCQFGYKRNHSTSHAIEIIRTIERKHDAHVCLLDASSAFDKLSWIRINDQLHKRNVPVNLIRIVMIQLFSTKISVCGTHNFYPRGGVKQGGVLSGYLFSACYDDLVLELRNTGAGILIFSGNNNFTCVFVIIYADDVLLVSSSPNGLKSLIDKAFLFASRYNDISFNSTKSFILRLGKSRKPAVSVCGIPVSECQTYLGVDIGREAKPQEAATANLYKNANINLAQNYELHKCSLSVKNYSIYCYGNVYSIENFLSVNPRLRQAHRYLTKSVHTDWTRIADLGGPNITSRRLYTSYNLDSLEVIHRRRRNMFLINAEKHNNSLIAGIIGNLERITA